MKTKLILFLFLLTVTNVSAISDYTQSYNVDKVNRTALIYAPVNIEKNRPLLISLHGRWGDGRGQQQCAHFETIADTARFVVVYPDGLPQPVIGGNTGWDANGDTDNDIAFFKAVIDDMVTKYCIDRNRVYICGFSLGGMMTYHCANVASDIFAAFVSCSGYPLNEYKKVYTSDRPVPFMHIHGKDDGFVTYANLQPVVDNWVMRNGCNSVAEVSEKTGVYTEKCYVHTDGGFEFVYYSLDGIGHEYRNSSVFNTSLTIWNFVKKYALDTPCDKTLKWKPQQQIQTSNIPVGWSMKENVLSYGSDTNYPLQIKAGKYRINFSSNKEIKNFQVQSATTLVSNVSNILGNTSVEFVVNSDTNIVLKWTIESNNMEMIISNLMLNLNDAISSIKPIKKNYGNISNVTYDLEGRKISDSAKGLMINNHKVIYVRK